MWVVPTLSRPDQCHEIVRRLRDSGCTTPGIVFVNGESHAAEYEKICLSNPDNEFRWEFFYNPENLGALGALNRVMELYPNEPWYGFIGDDEYLVGAGDIADGKLIHRGNARWDTTLIEKTGRWNVAHGNDLWQSHRRICGIVCIGGDLARAVGYVAIPGCWHSFGFDNLWEEVAHTLNLRRWCADVVVEHRHPLNGKGKEDDCYRLAYSSYEKDETRFREWYNNERIAVLERVREAMKHG